MPWVAGTKNTPSRYAVPFGAGIFDAAQIRYAKAQRKHSGIFREEMLHYQKMCASAKDALGARFFKEEAARSLKEFRGWDASIKWMEGDLPEGVGRYPGVSEDTAPYVDRAFALADIFGNEQEKIDEKPTT